MPELRGYAEFINGNSMIITVDFAYANYSAKADFFNELNRIMVTSATDNKVVSRTGAIFDLDTLAGTVSLQLYMQQVETAYQVVDHLSQLGVNQEKQMWKLGGN